MFTFANLLQQIHFLPSNIEIVGEFANVAKTLLLAN